MKNKLALLLALAVLFAMTVAVLHYTGNLTVFEDGSWGIGKFPYVLSGCLPSWTGAICN